MTTVLVTEDNMMLSDSQMSLESFIISYDCSKIEKINGHLVGVSGIWSDAFAFKQWFAKLEEAKEASEIFTKCDIPIPEKEEDSDYGFCALVLSPDGTLTYFEDNNKSFEVEKPYAIGSGGQYAICSLDGGSDNYTAMTVAIKRDVYSGGKIHVLKLEEEGTEDEYEENDDDL